MRQKSKRKERRKRGVRMTGERGRVSKTRRQGRGGGEILEKGEK